MKHSLAGKAEKTVIVRGPMKAVFSLLEILKKRKSRRKILKSAEKEPKQIVSPKNAIIASIAAFSIRACSRILNGSERTQNTLIVTYQYIHLLNTYTSIQSFLIRKYTKKNCSENKITLTNTSALTHAHEYI